MSNIVIAIFMFPIDLIFSIFGSDPDRPMFYLGLPFIGLYLLALITAATGLIVFMILSGFYMFSMFLVWVGLGT